MVRWEEVPHRRPERPESVRWCPGCGHPRMRWTEGESRHPDSTWVGAVETRGCHRRPHPTRPVASCEAPSEVWQAIARRVDHEPAGAQILRGSVPTGPPWDSVSGRLGAAHRRCSWNRVCDKPRGCPTRDTPVTKRVLSEMALLGPFPPFRQVSADVPLRTGRIRV